VKKVVGMVAWRSGWWSGRWRGGGGDDGDGGDGSAVAVLVLVGLRIGLTERGRVDDIDNLAGFWCGSDCDGSMSVVRTIRTSSRRH
jgi:hypothetical protein